MVHSVKGAEQTTVVHQPLSKHDAGGYWDNLHKSMTLAGHTPRGW